ncbi:MAG: uncharacterized SAM-binding protein YcdF (DUF218 family) [Bradymonadia bacterium]|jgi:uncharacterized SAM-binding protein YcdF (DUF218 family)
MLAFVLASLAFVFAVEAHRSNGRRRKALGSLAVAVLVGFFVALPSLGMVAKIIGTMLMPSGMIWLYLIAKCAWLSVRKLWSQLAPSCLLLVLYTCAGNFWLGATWLGSYEAAYESVDPFARHYDAVCVLGGGVHTNTTGRPQLTTAGDRALLGAQLWYAGNTPLLIASGRTVPGANATDDLSTITSQVWKSIGVPEDAIILLPEPHDTRSEMQAYAALAEERRWTTVGVVTSAWHLPRAELHARAAGFEFVPLPADFRGGPTWEGLYSLIPNGSGFQLMSFAAWETLGALTRQ